mmetsp:Transcript_38552/g.115151  ORF Transcript_38552/g.115151 Transcript_38552/m.115151 type:complete len:432 (-) Transcript_38552:78-1373(-)
MVLIVTVVFRLDDERWTHDFEVERGSTVWQLKESMLGAEATREDVDAFELQHLGRRVPDLEKVYQAFTFDFEYLGPEEGKRRSKNEVAELEAWERQRQEEEAAKLRRPKPVVQEAAPAAQSNDATPFDSKPVIKGLPPLPAGDHEISITIDRGMDLQTVVTVQGGALILNVKEALSAQDPTGQMNVASFGLGIAGDEEAAKALPDDTVLTEKHLKLEIAEPYVESAEEAANKPFPYTPADRSNVAPSPPLPPRWEVVGGGDKGGILVREGQDTKSTQLPSRLSTGAVVNELRIEGERLQYEKVWGDGPDTGWVSLTLSGRDLLVKREPTFEELFTLDRALDLQEELMYGFSQPEFQRALDGIFAEFPEGKGFKFTKRRNELFMTVQSQVLPKYGFAGDASGVMHMMRAFAPHQAAEVGWNNDQLNALLRLG